MFQHGLQRVADAGNKVAVVYQQCSAAMAGAEYVTAGRLSVLWHEIDEAFRA